jgi:hypothetical protein
MEEGVSMDAADCRATTISLFENMSDHPFKTGFSGFLFQKSGFSFWKA